MLPLFGGAPEYMLQAIQKKQNEAMRLVVKRKWSERGTKLMSTKELLKQCNYLSVKQMVYYHSVAMVHKTLKQQAPVYLHDVLLKAMTSGVRHRYPTRTSGKRVVAEASLSVANTSFRWRAGAQYAALPANIKEEQNIKSFLIQLKRYTIEQIEI